MNRKYRVCGMSRRERERFLSAAAIIVAPLNLSTDNAVSQTVECAVKLHKALSDLNRAENQALAQSHKST